MMDEGALTSSSISTGLSCNDKRYWVGGLDLQMYSVASEI